MGIFDRIKTLVSANVNSAKEKRDSIENDTQLQARIREAQENLRTVEAKIAAASATETAAKRRVDDCNAEIARIEKYIAEATTDEDRTKYTAAKETAISRKEAAERAYEQTKSSAASLKDQINSIVGTINEAQAKLQELSIRLKTAQASENPGGISAEQYKELAENVQKQIDTADAKAQLEHELENPSVDLNALKQKYDSAPAQDAPQDTNTECTQ